ncbi:transcription factor [Pseudogymnoascus australis]
MEDPLTMSATDAFNMLDDSQLPSFSYPDAYLDYQVPDFFNQTYLSGPHLTTTTSAGPSYPSDDTPHSALTTTSNAPLDFPKPQDDLSHFFADSPFSSPGPNQRYAPVKGQGQGYSPAWGSQPQQQDGWSNSNNNANNHINNNNNNQASGSQQQQPLAILTSGFEPGDARTVVHHGQVTPGDSPETATSPGPGKGRASTRRASRKGKESISSIATTATTASSSSRRDSAITAASSPPSPAPAKVKKPRKPRRSSKKPTTAEQAALKRETFLKRNREAAYKCRVKKKTQTEEVVERVKALGEDNRAKAAEVERLRREVEGLRGLLLPHYRVCGDERVVAYLDGLGAVGGAWGSGAAGRLGSLAGLGGEMGGLGLGGDEGSLSGDGRRESVGSVGTGVGSEGYNNAGGEQEMMDEEEEEEEREEQRRRESEDLEEMFKGSAGGGGFDSGVTPVVDGMGPDGMVGGLEGMNGMGGMGAGGMEMIGGMGEGMDEVLGMGMV